MKKLLVVVVVVALGFVAVSSLSTSTPEFNGAAESVDMFDIDQF